MDRLACRVALVTGGAGGIGSASAQRLAREGASVVVSDIRAADGEKVAAGIRADGGRAVFAQHDVTDEEAWQSVVRDIREEFGRLDILVNNAAGAVSTAVEETSKADYDRVVALTQTSVFLGMKHAGAALKESGHGSVINISSIYGASGAFGDAFAYHAAKGAVRLMTKNVALCWATSGVRVNSVHPGFIQTPPIAEKGAAAMEVLVAATPMARLGEASEVASVVAFLAGDDASFITGSEIYVDGGFLAR